MTTTLCCYSYRLKVTFHLLFSVIKPHSVVTDSYQQKPECCLHQPSPGWIITVPRPRIIPRDRPPLIAAMAYTVTMAGPCGVIPCAPLIHDRHHRCRRLKWNDWGRSGEKRGDLLSAEVREQSIWGRHGADHHFEKRKKKKEFLEKVSGGPGIWKHAAQPFNSLCLAARAASVWLMPQRGFAVACGIHTQRAL